jgi:hypothetical protein
VVVDVLEVRVQLLGDCRLFAAHEPADRLAHRHSEPVEPDQRLAHLEAVPLLSRLERVLREDPLAHLVVVLIEPLASEGRRFTEFSVEGEIKVVAAERDSIRGIFPINQDSMTAADLEGTYGFLFVPIEGACTYVDCDQFGDVRYMLSIARTSRSPRRREPEVRG